MNLLIVEDELRLRSNLANNIPWEAHQIEVIGLAENGREALRFIEIKKPDLILLDIQMPELNGIELAQQVKHIDPLIQMIVLSGHDNFHFAQSALDLGVFRYLLKPAGEETILQTVLEAAEAYKQEVEKRHNLMSLQQKWRDHFEYVQQAFFQNLILGKYDQWQIQKKAADLQLPLQTEALYAIALIRADPLSEQETRYKASDGPLLNFSIKNLSHDILNKPDNCYVFHDGDEQTVVLFHSSHEDDPENFQLYVHTAISKVLSVIKEALKITVSAGISHSDFQLAKLDVLYQQAKHALLGQVLYGSHIALPYQRDTSKQSYRAIPTHLEKSLEIALETADLHTANHLVAELWEQGMKQIQHVDHWTEFLLYTCSLFTRMLHKMGWSIQEVMGNDAVYFLNLQLLTSREQAAQWLHRLVRRYIQFLQQERRHASHEVITRILELIEKEIDQELTLQVVAEKLHFNSSYLSRLFKQEMNTTFSAYLLERKMEMAKQELLRGSKVGEVALRVGFKDASYFTRVFRKYWGVTPMELLRLQAE